MICGNAATSRPYLHTRLPDCHENRNPVGIRKSELWTSLVGYMTVLCDDIGASVVLMANEVRARHYLPQSC